MLLTEFAFLKMTIPFTSARAPVPTPLKKSGSDCRVTGKKPIVNVT